MIFLGSKTNKVRKVSKSVWCNFCNFHGCMDNNKARILSSHNLQVTFSVYIIFLYLYVYIHACYKDNAALILVASLNEKEYMMVTFLMFLSHNINLSLYAALFLSETHLFRLQTVQKYMGVSLDRKFNFKLIMLEWRKKM